MGQHKHTSGPWVTYDDRGDGKTNRIEIAAIGKTVARIYHSEPDEDISNARLIAAAPDLLAALEMALIWLDYEGKYDVQGIRAAIAKATGGDA